MNLILRCFSLKEVFIYFVLLVSFKCGYGQNEVCSKLDTSLCLFSKKFYTPVIIMEKRLFNSEDILTTDIPLLADMDGDCVSEILMPDYDGKRLLFIDSKTGLNKIEISTPYLRYASSENVATADLDGDGMPEIFIKAPTINVSFNVLGKLICYNLDGSIRWISDQRYESNLKNLIGGRIGLADFNMDGNPEIYVNNKIFNASTGAKLVDGGDNGFGIVNINGPKAFSIAAQLDGDLSDLELAAGYTIYKVKIVNLNGTTGNSMTAYNMQIDNKLIDGYTAVADINLDGILDVVVTTAGVGGEAVIYAYTLPGRIPRLIAKAYPPGNDIYIGPPSVGNIQGIGKPSIVFTRVTNLLSYMYDGTGIFKLEWRLSTTDSSGMTGLTMFDLDNDGRQEIVYRDETELKIVNGFGSQPFIVSRIECFSPTWNDYPVVADVDHTGHAKICVPCGLSADESHGRVCIFSPPDSLPGWAPARGIWNQYNYHVLNINDDLTVPRIQKSNATYMNGNYNNFLVQESLVDSNGMYKVAAASLWGEIICVQYDTATDAFDIQCNVYNRPEASRASGDSLVLSLYEGNPESGGSLIDSLNIYYNLRPGDTLRDVVIRIPRRQISSLYLVVNATRLIGNKFAETDFLIPECDYTDNVSRWEEFPDVVLVEATLCEGRTFEYRDSSYSREGKYFYISKDSRACDSEIAIVYLRRGKTSNSEFNYSGCDSARVMDTTFYDSGDWSFNFITREGCDSTVIAHVNIYRSSEVTIDQTVCDSLEWNGQTLRKTGRYPFASVNAHGCDSLTVLELVVNRTQMADEFHAHCGPFLWNGNTYTESGSYPYTTLTTNGCDSTVTLHLTVDSSVRFNESVRTCGEYMWNGKLLSKSGQYIDTFQTAQGCDSIVNLELQIQLPSQSMNVGVSCDSFEWNGIRYRQSGIYVHQTINASGCDSIAYLDLVIYGSSSFFDTMRTCGELIWNGIRLNQSGDYQFKTKNTTGCDSMAYLHLQVYKSDTIVIYQRQCDSYDWNGRMYDQTGIYVQQFMNSSGCDSLVILHLNMVQSSDTILQLGTCDSMEVFGKYYSKSGNYMIMGVNHEGCDSLIQLELKVLSSVTVQTVESCDSYTWPVNGKTYSRSGEYSEGLINQTGCDSIVMLDLEIAPTYHDEFEAETCDEYFWPVTRNAYKRSGVYNHPLVTTRKCDSILTLRLVVNPSFFKVDTVRASNAYTWPINGESYVSSGSYFENYHSERGCDSIYQLVLTIIRERGIYAPNVINPNGLNWAFTLYDNGQSIKSIEKLSIFDRWGELIWRKSQFLPNDPAEGWNGRFNDRPVVPGVYVWLARVVLEDGSVTTEYGNVTVLK